MKQEILYKSMPKPRKMPTLKCEACGFRSSVRRCFQQRQGSEVVMCNACFEGPDKLFSYTFQFGLVLVSCAMMYSAINFPGTRGGLGYGGSGTPSENSLQFSSVWMAYAIAAVLSYCWAMLQRSSRK